MINLTFHIPHCSSSQPLCYLWASYIPCKHKKLTSKKNEKLVYFPCAEQNERPPNGITDTLTKLIALLLIQTETAPHAKTTHRLIPLPCALLSRGRKGRSFRAAEGKHTTKRVRPAPVERCGRCAKICTHQLRETHSAGEETTRIKLQFYRLQTHANAPNLQQGLL